MPYYSGVIAPEVPGRINPQTSRLVLLRNNLLVSALIFALLECWRPYFFLTDDNLDGSMPYLTELGQRLLSGNNPFLSGHLFGGNYNVLRDPTFFSRHPLYLLVSLLTATPFHYAVVDIICFCMYLLAAAGFVNLAWYLRDEMQLTVSDGWLMFYTQSFTYSMMALTTGASWHTFLGNHSALPWLVLGILQKSWRNGIGLIALFSLHQLLGGHPLPTISSTIFLSLFALGMSISRRSWQPLGSWTIGYTIAIVVLLPFLVPMLEGGLSGARAAGVPLDDMQSNNLPFIQFIIAPFAGTIMWLKNPHPNFYTTYTIVLGSSAAAWCVLPAMVSRGKWRGLEVVTVALLFFGEVLIIRPLWISEIMLRLPLLRSMRWPFRELLQFQFFLHLFLLVRPPGLQPVARKVFAIFGTVLLIVSMLAFPLPPTFNSMTWDRELILTGGVDQYWNKVRPLLKPTDRIAVIIPPDLYESNRFEEPYCLLDTYNYAGLTDTINAWGYSPAAPNDQFYTKTHAYYPFGAYIPSQKDALMAERPDLKFITLESLEPLRITLSSRDGPTIDLTPFVPVRHSKIPPGPVPK